MLDSFIIVGLTLVIVNIIKSYPPFKTTRGKLYIPIIVFAVAGILNVTNALVFGYDLLLAFKEGLILGAAAGGFHSMAKKAMGKYKEA